MLDQDHAVPLDYGGFVIGSVFPFEVILFIEGVCVCYANFYVVKQLSIRKQRYSNNAKFMLVLKF